MRTPQDKTYLANTRKILKKSLKNDLSYGKLSIKLGVSKGCLWRFLNKGYLPKDKQKQIALGVDLINIDIIPCPRCGGVHTRKCPEKKKNESQMSIKNWKAHNLIKHRTKDVLYWARFIYLKEKGVI